MPFVTSPYNEYILKRQKKHRVDFFPNFISSLKIIVKGVTMAKMRHMYGTKVPNFIGLWLTDIELLNLIGSYPPNSEMKINRSNQ